MAENFDITSANAESVLIFPEMFPGGIRLQNYSTDSGINMASLDRAETRMGVDGKMVAGVIFNIKDLEMTFEPCSPSVDLINKVWLAMETLKKPFVCTLVCACPSIGYVFTFNKGVIQRGAPFPNINRTLQPIVYGFHFESMVPAAY